MSRGELKKYAIEALSRRPKKEKALSSCVLIDDGKVLSHCYIRFADELVEFVGRRLPKGIAPFHPAYLAVVADMRKGNWRVEARYHEEEVSAVLWESATRPAWSIKAKRGSQRGSSEAHKTHTDSGAGDRPGSASGEPGSGSEHQASTEGKAGS